MSTTFETPLRIGRDHPALCGHFPGHPVVPGVVVLERVAAWKAWRGIPTGALDAKFMQPLLPGQPAIVALHEDGSGVRFSVTREDGAAMARGRLSPSADAAGATAP